MFCNLSLSIRRAARSLMACALFALSPIAAEAALVGHWTFDNTANDSANSQHGTLTNGAAYTTNRRVGSHALILDGNDDFVELGTVGIGNPLMLNGSPYTFSAWTFQNAGDPSQRIFDKSSGANGTNGYAFYGDPSGSNALGVSNHGTSQPGGLAPVNGVWRHVMATNDGTNVYFYVNGVKTSLTGHASPGLPPNISANMRIGTWNHTTGREWNGMLDDIGIFNQVNTETQAMAFYTLSADGDPLGNGADLDYNLSQAQALLDLHAAATGSVTIDGNTWTYTTGLTTDLGELTKELGVYYLRLDASGSGVTTYVAPPIPEPSSLALLLVAASCCALRRRNARGNN